MAKDKPAYTAWSIRKSDTKRAFPHIDKYAIQSGRVMWAWNDLQKQYQILFCRLVSPHNIEIGIAAWNTLVSDQAQRDMLEATARVALTKGIEIKALTNIRWALKETRKLAPYRNIAAHTPVENYDQNLGLIGTIPDIMLVRARAHKIIQAIGFEVLFRTLIEEVGVLSSYVSTIDSVLFGISPGASARKPQLRLDHMCQEAIRRQDQPKKTKRKRPQKSSRV